MNTDEQRAIAEAATPANVWSGGGYEIQFVDREDRTGDNAGWHVSVEGVGSFPIGWFHREEDAKYLATFDPPTVLALLGRLAALEAERAAGEARVVERCASVAYQRNSFLDCHEDSPNYGLGAPRNDFDRGRERGREEAAQAIRAALAKQEPGS